MGASQSTTSSLVMTRAELLKATDQPRLLVNRLFSFFAEKFAQKDLLALGNPQRCTEYVFVMADALNRLFYELRVEPGKDKKGVLLFRKTQELSRLDPESFEGQQRRVLCLSVGFFYIRIFQIYAALALSVNDDANAGTGFSTGFGAPAGTRDAMIAPGLEGIYSLTGGSSSAQIGGVTYENIRKFAILKQYISRDITRPAGYFTFDKYPNVVLNVSKESKNLSIFKLTPGIDGPDVIICNFTIRLSTASPDRRLITFDKFSSTQTIYNDRLKDNGPIAYFVKKSGGDNLYVSEKTGESIDDLIFRVMLSSRDVASGRRAPNKARVRGGPKGDGIPAIPAGPVGVLEGLRTDEILRGLKKVPKPLAHCVARSLQLLNIDALATARLPTEVKTSICKTKFDVSQGGLPDIGAYIISSPSISALHQLFYDKLASGKPAMSEQSAASYQTFVKAMAEQFGENPSSPAVQLGSVVNRMDKACASGTPSKKDKVLTVRDPNTIRLGQQAVQALWKFQINHDKKVLEIISKLIVVSKLPTGGFKIGLNPLILKTGNPGVAIIAQEARELLIAYYKNCETAFRIAAVPLGVSGTA